MACQGLIKAFLIQVFIFVKKFKKCLHDSIPYNTFANLKFSSLAY